MSLRHVLVAAAVPVPAEVDREARCQPFVHQLLRWDRVVSRVFGHVRVTSGRRDSRDAGTPLAAEDLARSPRMKKMSVPARLPDLLQMTAEERGPSPPPGPAAPAAADLSTALQRRLAHIQRRA
ncbi:uncharacterized protein LOC119094464 [Pollicipes pollicipes]|uniref:uncharacterized protein LOC119094464 n=1 Tax=Pollicipes pollicipes TaxID=41117 RepID=UPI0018859819|nr:uncharacterized protein LOC119094464 [Pollicipes pollicipes]